MDQPWIKRGSTWINVDQPPSACRLQRVAALTHGSCVMRPDSWLMRHALSPLSVQRFRLTCHASGVRLMAHASDSWLMRQASCVPRFRLMRQASCVPRFRRQASDSTSLIQPPIQPPPVVGHDDNTAAAFPHATPFRFAPIELYGMG